MTEKTTGQVPEYNISKVTTVLTPVRGQDGKLYLNERTDDPNHPGSALEGYKRVIGPKTQGSVFVATDRDPGGPAAPKGLFPGAPTLSGGWSKLHPVTDKYLAAEIEGWLADNGKMAMQRTSHMVARGPEYLEGEYTPGNLGHIPVETFRQMVNDVNQGQARYADPNFQELAERQPQARQVVQVERGNRFRERPSEQVQLAQRSAPPQNETPVYAQPDRTPKQPEKRKASEYSNDQPNTVVYTSVPSMQELEARATARLAAAISAPPPKRVETPPPAAESTFSASATNVRDMMNGEQIKAMQNQLLVLENKQASEQDKAKATQEIAKILDSADGAKGDGIKDNLLKAVVAQSTRVRDALGVGNDMETAIKKAGEVLNKANGNQIMNTASNSPPKSTPVEKDAGTLAV